MPEKNKKNKKIRNIIIGLLCGVLLLMTVGYTLFGNVLKIKGTSNVTSNWDIRITNVSSKNILGNASNVKDPTWDNLTATFITNLEAPGDSIEYDVTVENKGNLNAKLEKINMTETKNPAIKFTTSGLTEGETLNAGSSAVLTVKIEYDKNVTEQPTDTKSELKVTLDYVQADGKNVNPSGPAAADNLTKNVVVTGDGLYEDPIEEGRYVYRGANPNNYITFNGEKAGWRIIAVEADGTLKLMKKDNAGSRVFEEGDSRQAAYCNKTQWGCNIWGSSSTMLDADGNHVTSMPIRFNGELYDLPTEESGMAKYLNNNYYNALSDEAKNQIDRHLWNIGPLVKTEGQTLETDISQEKSYKWRGNIGLINITDYVKATTDTTCTTAYTGWNNENCGNNNYMYQSSYNWWTISAYYYNMSYFLWSVYSAGVIHYGSAVDTLGVHPVVYLKSHISLSGTGTQADPYTIAG